MKNKIALSGLPGVGKDTVAEILKTRLCERGIIEHPEDIFQIAFADRIKDIALAFVDCAVDDFSITQDYIKGFRGPSEYRESIIPYFSNNHFVTYRKLLNDIGELGRGYHPDFWINRALNEMREVHYSFNIITDLRRQNEAERLLKEGFTLIRIVRNLPEMKITFTHTETELNNHWLDAKFHYILNNNGTYEKLIEEVDLLIDYLISV